MLAASNTPNPRTRPVKSNPRFLLIALLAAATVSLLAALGSGSMDMGSDDLLNALLGQKNADPLASSVLWELRIPRALAAFVTGGLLALAGVLMQVLLRNPLADPYILGVSGGAAVAVLSAMLAGIGAGHLAGIAFAGALGALLLLYLFAQRLDVWSSHSLLLTGVMLSAGWSALIGLLLSLSPETGVLEMLHWLMGDLSSATLPLVGAPILAIAAVMSWSLARPLNLLAQGELRAQTLGVSVKPLQIALLLIASLLTASAVSIAGSVGFIGLVVPHLLRLLIGNQHRWLIPLSLLLGGTLLTLADTLARTLIAPRELPVGVVTALLGVPLFLYLLHRSGARRD